jgi:hypothetical protein
MINSNRTRTDMQQRDQKLNTQITSAIGERKRLKVQIVHTNCKKKRF